MAPCAGRRVQLADPVRDVLPCAERRVARCLGAPGPSTRRTSPLGTSGRSTRTRPWRRSTWMPLSRSHCAIRFASASLRWPRTRKHPGTGSRTPVGYGDHPVVLVLGEPRTRPRAGRRSSSRVARSVTPRRKISSWSSRISRRWSSQNVRGGVEPDVLGPLGSEPAVAALDPTFAHLQRGAVDAVERHVRLGVEGPPVVPSLCVGRPTGGGDEPAVGVPLVDRAG